MKNGKPTPYDLGLKSDSFTEIKDEDLLPRVIANIYGAQKSGKNHFALTAPGPIVIFNFDCGLEGVVEKFVRLGKSITVSGVPGSQEQGKYPSYRFARPLPNKGQSRKDGEYLNRVKTLANPIWERFIADLSEFYGSEARTGIIDTGGAAYALSRFAFHGMDKGRPDQKADPYGQKSGDMKALFQGLMTDGYSYDKNMLWLHRSKELWEDNKPSGKTGPEGYNGVAYEVQVNLKTDKFKATLEEAKRYGVKAGDTVRKVEVGDCRLNAEMEGEKFYGAECNFPYVMAAITGTDVEVWE